MFSHTLSLLRRLSRDVLKFEFFRVFPAGKIARSVISYDGSTHHLSAFSVLLTLSVCVYIYISRFTLLLCMLDESV